MSTNKGLDILQSVIHILRSRGERNIVKIHYAPKEDLEIEVVEGTIVSFTDKYIMLRQQEGKNVSQFKVPLERISDIVDVSFIPSYKTTLTSVFKPDLVTGTEGMLEELATTLEKYQEHVAKSLIGESVQVTLNKNCMYSQLRKLNGSIDEKLLNSIIRAGEFDGIVIGLTLANEMSNLPNDARNKKLNFLIVVNVNEGRGSYVPVIISTEECEVTKSKLIYWDLA